MIEEAVGYFLYFHMSGVTFRPAHHYGGFSCGKAGFHLCLVFHVPCFAIKMRIWKGKYPRIAKACHDIGNRLFAFLVMNSFPLSNCVWHFVVCVLRGSVCLGVNFLVLKFDASI